MRIVIKDGMNILQLMMLAGDHQRSVFIINFNGQLSYPEEVCSWRGSYREPTLTRTAIVPYSKKCTGSDLLAILNKGLNNSHEGYKGGYYEFSSDQHLWFDNCGCYNRYVATSYEVFGEKVIINIEDKI